MPDIVWDERRERSEAFSETDETYVPFPGCETGLNRMIFSLNGEGSCDCPAHASCELDTGCHCDFGYEISSDGSCQEKNCPSVKEITEITEEYCCEKVSGVWDGIVGCVCPEESYFNGTSCVASQGFCVYSYEGPSGGGYYSDCSYTFSETNGTTLAVSRESYPSGQYCILKWTDTDCSREIDISGASVIYGRCATLSTYYSRCRRYDENHVPTVLVRQGCEIDQYCRLNWSSETCDTISAEGENLIYGVCLELDKSSPMTCPVEKEEGV